MAKIEKPSLSSIGLDLFRSEKYADFTIHCGGRQWRVHRSVICPRSSYFAAACDGDFKDANDCIIELEDEDPAVVDKLLEYMYTLRYDNGIKLDAKGDNLKFENGSLKTERDMDLAIKSLQALNEQIYEKMIANPYYDFHAIVLHILQLTPNEFDELRQIVVDHCSQYVPELLGSTNTKSVGENDWVSVLKEDATFAVAVLQDGFRRIVSDMAKKDAKEKALIRRFKDWQTTYSNMQSKLALKESNELELKRVSDKAVSEYIELVSTVSEILISVQATMVDRNRNSCTSCKSTDMPRITRASVDSDFTMDCRHCGKSISVPPHMFRDKAIEAFQSALPN